MKYNTNNKKYNVDENFFKVWSSEMSYILGLIYTDGNLDRNKFRMRISSIDIQILNEINAILKSNRPIRLEKNVNGEWFTLYIDNREIYKELIKLGVSPNKTKICKIPTIPPQFLGDFLRGVIDGDGCVYEKTIKNSKLPILSIDIATASNDFKNGLLQIMSKYTDDKKKVSVQTRKNGLHILRTNNAVSTRIYEDIYYDNCLCLKRKKEKFETILNKRNLLKELS